MYAVGGIAVLLNVKFIPATTLGMLGFAVAPEEKVTLPDKLVLSNWTPVTCGVSVPEKALLVIG